MHYIYVEDLIKELEELPKDTKITSIGRGYFGDKQYLAVHESCDRTVKEIELQYEPNG